MSAIGSVMVMGFEPFSPRFRVLRDGPVATRNGSSGWAGGLPGGLRDAGQLATVRHVPDADSAEAELAVDGLRATALLATRVSAHRELRLGGGLDDQRLLRHGQFSLNGKPRSLS